MIKRWLIINTIVIGLFLPGCSSVAQPYEVLQGKVTIGPILPVEQPGVNYEIPCEVYEARKIMVYDENHKKLIEQVDIDCNGNYHVELDSGSYVIDINRTGIDHSSDVPAKIEIEPGETIQLDIDIDTGIR